MDIGAPLAFTEGPTPAARSALERSIELNPESGFTWVYLGTLELLDGKLDAARAACARSDDPWALYGEALVEHAAGNAEKAQALLDEYAGATATAPRTSWRRSTRSAARRTAPSNTSSVRTATATRACST